jgi:hypothetical protein
MKIAMIAMAETITMVFSPVSLLDIFTSLWIFWFLNLKARFRHRNILSARCKTGSYACKQPTEDDRRVEKSYKERRLPFLKVGWIRGEKRERRAKSGIVCTEKVYLLQLESLWFQMLCEHSVHARANMSMSCC